MLGKYKVYFVMLGMDTDVFNAYKKIKFVHAF